MKQTVRLSESDVTRLVKKIINESIPKGLTQILRNLDQAVKLRTVQQLEGLLSKREIDNFIIINGKRGTIKNGEQVLNNFIAGNLRSADSEKVFNVIFKTAEDKEQIEAMADFLITQPNFVSKYKGKTKQETRTCTFDGSSSTIEKPETLQLKGSVRIDLLYGGTCIGRIFIFDMGLLSFDIASISGTYHTFIENNAHA